MKCPSARQASRYERCRIHVPAAMAARYFSLRSGWPTMMCVQLGSKLCRSSTTPPATPSCYTVNESEVKVKVLPTLETPTPIVTVTQRALHSKQCTLHTTTLHLRLIRAMGYFVIDFIF